MGFNLHAGGTNDPDEVRNWRIHMIAIIASMSTVAMGYETSVIGGTMALDSFRRDFGLTSISQHTIDTLHGNIVPVYISEISPPSIRGRLVWGCSRLRLRAVACVASGSTMLWTGPSPIPSPPNECMVPLGLQLLPGILLFSGILFSPESSRWLAKHNRWEGAKNVLVHIRTLPADHDHVTIELDDIKRQFHNRNANRLTKLAIIKKLFKRLTQPYRYRPAANDIPDSDRVEHHHLLLPSHIQNPWHHRQSGTSTKLFATGFYCMSWQVITWFYGYCSEIFSLEMRMLCVAITTADQWLWSFVVSRTTPYMITSLGYGTYMLFGALMVSMGIWTFFFVPETKGLTLEDMDLLFMRSMHRTVWTALREKKIVHEVLADTSPAVHAPDSEEEVRERVRGGKDAVPSG